MIRLVSWNIGKRAAPWHCLAKMAERGQADVALLQEAGNPPDGLEYPLRCEDGVFRDRSCYDRCPLIVQLSDRVEVEWFRQVPLWSEVGEQEIGVRNLRNLDQGASLKAQPPGIFSKG